MMRKYLITMMAVFGFAVLPACEALDQDVSAHGEMAVNEAEQGLLPSYIWKGNIAYDTIKSSTLTNTSMYENAHQWRFTPTAGQTVTFGLDIPTSAGGAWLCSSTSTAFPPTSCIKEAKSTTATHVEFTQTFANTTPVYLYVRQGTPAVGSFAYKLSTQKERCATMNGTILDTYWTPSTGTWSMMAAKHFVAGSTENPSTWTPSYAPGNFTTSTRVVMLGACTSNKSTTCGTSGPAVCESDYTFLGQSMVANACSAKNLILERADNVTPDAWIGWWKAMAQCPGE